MGQISTAVALAELPTVVSLDDCIHHDTVTRESCAPRACSWRRYIYRAVVFFFCNDFVVTDGQQLRQSCAKNAITD
jgi:hypothetical protein